MGRRETIHRMEWFIAVMAVAALGVAAMAAAGGMGQMSKEPVYDTYRPELPDTPLSSSDLGALKFGVTIRGYAMGQVDDVLQRLATEIESRDVLIAELTADRGAVDAQAPAVAAPWMSEQAASEGFEDTNETG